MHNDEQHYPDVNKVNTKIVVLGSLVCILLVLILSILFPSPSQDNTPREQSTESTDSTATTEAVTTGWQIINGRKRYINNDGSIAISQWIDGYYVGPTGNIITCAVTPDGCYVNADGHRDDSIGTKGSKRGLSKLEHTLTDMVDDYSGTWSVYVKDLGHAEYLSINNVQQYSASMIKIYCAATAYDLMDKGELEETETINRLMREMISVSDNDAFNLMVANCSDNYSQVTGRGIIQEYINREGYTGTTIATMLVPTKYQSPSSPGRNLTTAEDCGLLMERIYKKKCVSTEASDEFLQLLLNQEHINKIPAGLPQGTRCANKTGDTDEVQHDAAIVYSPGGDYIITVMSSNCGSAIPNIQNISQVVYEYFNE